MRYAVVACQVLTRELCSLLSRSGNTCTPYFLEQGLHNTPEILNKRLSESIDTLSALPGKHGEAHMFDAILLGYGLCCNGIIGLSAKEIPLIVPRCDDCIALFLGSYQRYLDIFHSHKGIYWYNPGWIEYGSVPTKDSMERKHQNYVEQFGEDNADYLMEEEQRWVKQYSHAIFIQSPEAEASEGETLTREAANFFGWEFAAVKGGDQLLRDLIEGRHDDRFLLCPPGHKIVPTFDERKIDAEPSPSEMAV